MPCTLPYSGKLSREKTFANFAVLWLFTKVFFTKFGGIASFGAAKASNPRKFSLKFSRYTVSDVMLAWILQIVVFYNCEVGCHLLIYSGVSIKILEQAFFKLVRYSGST